MHTTRRNLTLKLLLLLALPPLLGVSTIGLLSGSFRRRELLAEAERELRDHAATLRSTLPLVAACDPGRLAPTVERIARIQRVHGIAIYDPACRPIARSQDLDADAPRVDRLACSRAGGVQRIGEHDVLLRVETLEGSEHVGAMVVTYHLEAVERIIRRGVLRISAAGTVLAALMAAVALLLARSLGRSLGDLVHAAGQVAAGDLSVRVRSSGILELGRLGRSFNAMTDALAAARAELDQAESRRREQERRLLHAQTLRVVGQVAASLAHEIASPLSTILGWSRLVAGQEELPAPFREQAGVVAAQCERITRIVQRLMNVARPAEEAREPVRLQTVIRAVAEFLRAECQSRRVRVVLDLDEEVPPIVAELDRCMQVVMNLCVNAIQAQPRGGLLVLALQRAQLPDGRPGVVLEVRDAGPGIPPARRTTIFEPFYSTKAAGGMGIGLSIVSDIVRELGGGVAASDAPEGGACFRVELPIEGGSGMA